MNTYINKHKNEEWVKTLIPVVKKQKDAKFVLECCLRGKSDEWINQTFALFYSPAQHPEGSNYFALYYQYGFDPEDRPKLMITNGISAVENKDGTPVTYTALVNDAGEFIYSANRHDCQIYDNMMIDGGRDYYRSNMNTGKLEQFIIKDGEILFDF